MQAQKYWGDMHAVQHFWDVPKFVVGFFEAMELHGFSGIFFGSVGVSFAAGLLVGDVEARKRLAGVGLYAGNRAGYERDVHFVSAL